MSRDDTALYTGASSATFASVKQQPVKVEKTEAKQEQRQRLAPGADIILGILDSEMEKVQKIDFLNVENMLSDEHFKSELMARKKYVDYLKVLKTRITNILREPAKPANTKEPEGFDVE